MAEVQKNPQSSGEMTRRFIEFVLMQAQQVALMLGQMPGPDGKAMQPNLPVARIFIDQLDMIREKTRGNLTTEESDLLNKILSDLQMAFVEADKTADAAAPTPSATPVSTAEEGKPETAEQEDKKKFTKSYG